MFNPLPLGNPRFGANGHAAVRHAVIQTASQRIKGRNGIFKTNKVDNTHMGVRFPVFSSYDFSSNSALEAIKSLPRNEAKNVSAFDSGTGVEVGDVGSYKIIQHLEKTGDKLTGDHQPSGAAIKEAIRIKLHEKLKQVLTRSGANNAYSKAITIVVTDSWHKAYSRTYGGRNTKWQIAEDAKDLGKAATEDFTILIDGLLAEKHSVENIEIMAKNLHEARQNFFKTGKMQFRKYYKIAKPPSLFFGRCGEKTHTGRKCMRPLMVNSKTCWQHK